MENASDSSAGLLAGLEEQIRVCSACSLHRTRTLAVPGEGPADAEIMIVGEAPGATEDRTGSPFVGAAGRLLDTLLERIGLTREKVYITNVVKCRPPGNRDPLPPEVEACLPYLRRQFQLIRPRAVIVLGRHALERMLPGVGPISQVHGRIFMRGEVAFMPCYHPAAALHNGALIQDLEADFRHVQDHLARLAAPSEPGGDQPLQLPLI